MGDEESVGLLEFRNIVGMSIGLGKNIEGDLLEEGMMEFC